jgi:excisionase family DNA binding protein
MATTDLPLVLTVPEAARALRISRGSAYEAVRSGELPSVRIGHSIRVPRHALLDLLEGGGAPEVSDAGSNPENERGPGFACPAPRNPTKPTNPTKKEGFLDNYR